MNSRLHIVHLDRRVDRLKLLFRQLQSAYVRDYIIYPAIDAKHEGILTREAIHRSHKHIVQCAKNADQPNVIICEDDLVFSNEKSYWYFVSQIRPEYDLFCGCIYQGDTNEDGRILNGMSAAMTLYNVPAKFYDVFLDQPDNEHVDRGLGDIASKFNFYVCKPMVVTQSGGYSDNLRQIMYYDVYHEGKNFYKG